MFNRSIMKRLSSPLHVGLGATLVLLSVQGVLSSHMGTFKAKADISLLDLVGEFCLVLFITAWFLMVVRARRKNPTTVWLAVGFLGMLVSSFQDVLDEVIRFPEDFWLDGWIIFHPFSSLAR